MNSKLENLIKQYPPALVEKFKEGHTYCMHNYVAHQLKFALQRESVFTKLSESEQEEFLKSWYDCHKENVVSEDFEPISKRTFIKQFKEASVLATNRIENTHCRALEMLQNHPPKACELFPDELDHLQRLLTCCVYILSNQGTREFFLSETDAGRLLERKETTGRGILQDLLSCGILQRTRKGFSKVASEYRWCYKDNSSQQSPEVSEEAESSRIDPSIQAKIKAIRDGLYSQEQAEEKPINPAVLKRIKQIKDGPQKPKPTEQTKPEPQPEQKSLYRKRGIPPEDILQKHRGEPVI